MRGQTLVLACLYMLLLVLMALMTLGIAHHVREKIELNTLAETSAYSNAVATARTYNAVALMNRAAIAHWINLAGVESLISWTGLLFTEYLSVLQAVLPKESFGGGGPAPVVVANLPGYLPTGPDAADCRKAMANLVWTPLLHAYEALHVDWVEFLEDAAKAGEQGRRLQDAIGSLKDAQAGIVAELRAKIGSHELESQIIHAAQLSDVSAVASVDANNVSPWLDAPQTGLHSDKVWWAVMDAKSAWVKNRHNDPIVRLEAALSNAYADAFSGPYNLTDVVWRNEYERVNARGSVHVAFQTQGHGCFGTDFGSCEAGPDWTNALAEDKVTTQVTIDIDEVWHQANLINGKNVPDRGVCPPYRRIAQKQNASQVKASDIDHDDDFAFFDNQSYGGTVTSSAGSSPVWSQLTPAAITRHTMGPCTDNFFLRPCHSVYVGIVSLDHGAALGGQAKNYAGLARKTDAAAPKAPWALRFSFAFHNDASTTLDLGEGIDAVAVGTGIAYYHRRGHFTETPNLFNPYWRATLIGARRGVDDLGGLPPGADLAWTAIKGAGYRGEN